MKEPVTTWIQAEVARLDPPRDLKERNWVQLMLSMRVQEQFKKSIMEAVDLVAPLYADKFPH